MKYIDGILPPKTIKEHFEVSDGCVWYVALEGRYKLASITLSSAKIVQRILNEVAT
jgi:hypothetical protein